MLFDQIADDVAEAIWLDLEANAHADPPPKIDRDITQKRQRRRT